MRALTASELLQVWESVYGQPPLQRTLGLLSAACPDLSPQEVARLSIGERDARLLSLREWMFGTRMASTARCPQCEEQVEWETDVASIRLQESERDCSTQELTLQTTGFQIRFRLPNSEDIAAVLCSPDSARGVSQLLERCVLQVRRNGETVAVADLPDTARQAIAAGMEEADPQADIRMVLTCGACGYQWDTAFDIASFLWSEVNTWAEDMIRAVHRLASSYGWSERDILTMSPIRRQLYLGMVS